jgi:membrane fusion protein (multidrug efflux system)
MSGRRRRVLQVGVGLLAVVATVAWLSGTCVPKIRPGDAEVSSADGGAGTLAAVERTMEPVVEQASGSIESSRHTTVSSKILARIEDVRVRAGTDVKEGDVLVVLDARDLEARVQEAREAAAAARSQLELATSERSRTASLRKAAIAPQRDVDRAESAYRVAAAEVERAGQRQRDAEVALAEPGDTAAPGAPLLRIYDPGLLRLEAPVGESLAQHLAVGQPVQVVIDAVGERLDGEVEEIVPQAEAGARTFLVKVRFAPDPRVFAGMFGRLSVPAGERERLRIPAAAVEVVGQLEFVNAVGADGRNERRLVTTGARDESGRVEVLSGLSAGEAVRLPTSVGSGDR